MPIVEFDGPPSCSLWVEYKMTVGSGGGIHSVGVRGRRK